MIVSKLDSKLRVESPVADGRGTCFHFTVKLKRVQENSAAMAEYSLSQNLKVAAAAQRSLNNIRVMVSDVLLISGHHAVLITVFHHLKHCFDCTCSHTQICDDESINCRIFARKLTQAPIQELNWTAHTALALADCMQQCLEQPFDLIFLDEHFAGTATTGSEYITTLRQQGIRTPVLIASANCSDTDKALYMSR